MGALTRSGLLARKPKMLTVQLPDGESVVVRRLSSMDWERIKENDPDDQDIPRQMAMILCEEDGTRMFDPDNPEDVKACGEAIALSEAQPILEASGKITAGQQNKEDIKKNSEPTQPSDSVST